jgi:hypothetical protein
VILRLRPGATPAEREALLRALAAAEIPWRDEGDLLVLGEGAEASDAVAWAALPAVAAVDPAGSPEPALGEAFLRRAESLCLLLGPLAIAASLLPGRLGPPADPVRMPEDPGTPWPLAAWAALEERAPAALPVPLLVAGFGLGLLLWPLYARRLAERRPGLHAAVGVAALAIGAALGLLGMAR